MFGMSRMWLAVTQAINEIVDTRVPYTYEDYVKSLYPVAYWRLGEASAAPTAVDEIGNHDGTYVNSPTLGVTGLVTDDSNTAVTLNGTNEYITASDTGLPLGTSAATFSFLLKSTDASTLAIFEYGTNTAGQKMSVYVSSTGGVAVTLHSSNIYYSANVLNGNTHIVTVVLPANGTLNDVSIYVDGTLLTSVESSVSPTTAYNSISGGTIYIGRNISNTTFFNGTLDEIQILNYALTSQQVQNLYLLSIGLYVDKPLYLDYAQDLNPVAYWRLGESSGTIAYDISGNNHHGDYVGTPTLGATGLLTDDDDTAVDFNGTTQYIRRLESSFRGSDSLGSISAIIKTSDTDAGRILASDDEATSLYRFLFTINSDGQLAVYTNNGTGVVGINTNTTYNDGKTHHVVLTSDGSAYKMYVDGIEDTDISVLNGHNGAWFADISNRDNITIGTEYHSAGTISLFDGIIDEVKIFDYALTAQQVKDLYLLSEGVSLTPTSYNDTVRSLMPVSYWKLNETGSDTVAVDELGLYDGTYTNSPNLDSDSLVFGDGDTSATFTAASDQGVDLGLNLPINYGDSVSIIALLNVSSLNTNKCIMSRMDSSNVGWMLEFDSINTFRLLIRTTTTTNELDVKTRNEFVANKTYHLVFTLGGTTAADVSFYVDGIIQTNITSDDTWSSTPVYTSTDAYIGIRDYTSGYGMNGALDEVQFFDRVLNQVEITKLYNASKVMSLTLTIDSSLVDENLDDFPILVNLDATSGISDFDSTNIFDVYPNYVDSNFSTSKLMLRLTGTSGSTTFTDISTTPVSMTREGNAQIGTAVADPFGEYDGYLYLDGNGDSIYTSATQGNINTGNFTFECWIRPDLGGNANGGVIGTSITSSYNERCAVGLGGTSSPYSLQCWSQAGSGTGKFFNITGVILEGVWTHIVLQRVSGQGMLFINGVLRATGDIANDIDRGIIRLGHIYTGSTNTYYKGCISDAQAHYVARYDSNFEVPTRRFATGTAELHENIKSMNFVYPTQHSRSSQKCKVEIDRWDPINKQAQLWVKVPYISKDDDTVLQLTADSKGEDNSNNIGATGDDAAQAVWTEYDAVYHLSADGTDSTVNGYDGTLNGINSANIVDFGIGKGLSFNGTNEWVDLGDATPFDLTSVQDMSISAFIMSTDDTVAHADYFRSRYFTGGGFYARLQASGAFQSVVGVDPATNYALNHTGVLYTQDVALLVDINYDNSLGTINTFKDGTLFDDVTITGGSVSNSAIVSDDNINIGRSPTESEYFKGKIKEIRFSKSLKSSSWIAANNESTQDTLITYTVEE